MYLLFKTRLLQIYRISNFKRRKFILSDGLVFNRGYIFCLAYFLYSFLMKETSILKFFTCFERF